MNAKPHYFKIGLFVLIAVALIVAAIVVFGAGLFAHNELYFESYFSESITGLTVGSPLEFRGVRIGKVAEIGFVGNTYELPTQNGRLSPYALYVRVVTAIPQSKMPTFAVGQIDEVLHQMVQRGARVRVASNILTGQAYLEMNYLDPNRFPVEPIPWTPKYPRIPSAPGELTTIKDSIDKILTQLQAIDVEGLASSMQKLLTSLDTAIVDANIAELSAETRGLVRAGREKLDALQMQEINASVQKFLAALNQAVADANIPQLADQMRSVLTAVDQKVTALDTVRINADIERLLGALNQAVIDANVPALSQQALDLISEVRATNKYLADLLIPPESLTSRANVPEVVARLNQTVSQLNRLLATGRPEIQTILTELQETVANLNGLISNLEEHPSELLFSSPPRRSEVLK